MYKLVCKHSVQTCVSGVIEYGVHLFMNQSVNLLNFSFFKLLYRWVGVRLKTLNTCLNVIPLLLSGTIFNHSSIFKSTSSYHPCNSLYSLTLCCEILKLNHNEIKRTHKHMHAELSSCDMQPIHTRLCQDVLCGLVPFQGSHSVPQWDHQWVRDAAKSDSGTNWLHY